MKTAGLFAVISLALSVSAAATFQLEDGRRQIPLNVGQGNNNLNDNDTIALEQLERNGGGSNNGASTNSASSATSVSSASPVASESTNLKLTKYRTVTEDKHCQDKRNNKNPNVCTKGSCL